MLVVGDIDRGGVLAAMFGTLAVLEPADQALIAGFVVNKFRGDARLLAPGLDELARRTGRRTYGVLPWAEGLWLDVEDSLDLEVRRPDAPVPAGSDVLRVAVVRFPRISNLTDADALAAEPGVAVRFVTSPGELLDADLVVLPGTRATVADLGWLRERGLAAAVLARAAAGRPVLGVCGGYQMLARRIVDDVESGVGAVDGLGLLPAQRAVRRREDRRAYGRGGAGAPGRRATRSTTGGSARTTARRRSPAAAAPPPCGGRPGTARSSPTASAARSSPRSRRRRGATGDRARRCPSPASARPAWTRSATSSTAHLDTGGIRALIDGGVPPGLPILRSRLG